MLTYVAFIMLNAGLKARYFCYDGHWIYRIHNICLAMDYDFNYNHYALYFLCIRSCRIFEYLLCPISNEEQAIAHERYDKWLLYCWNILEGRRHMLHASEWMLISYATALFQSFKKNTLLKNFTTFCSSWFLLRIWSFRSCTNLVVVQKSYRKTNSWPHLESFLESPFPISIFRSVEWIT